MQAKAGQHRALAGSDLHLRDARTAAATLIAVAAWAYAAATLAVPEPQPYVDPRIERILRAGCKLPDVEGAFTFYWRRNGTIECGRYR